MVCCVGLLRGSSRREVVLVRSVRKEGLGLELCQLSCQSRCCDCLSARHGKLDRGNARAWRLEFRARTPSSKWRTRLYFYWA